MRTYSPVYSSQKLGTTQMSVKSRMDKMWHIHTTTSSTTMNKRLQHATAWKNLRNKTLGKRVKEYHAYDLDYVSMKSRKKESMVIDMRIMVTWGVVIGRSLRGLLQGWQCSISWSGCLSSFCENLPTCTVKILVIFYMYLIHSSFTKQFTLKTVCREKQGAKVTEQEKLKRAGTSL